MLRPVLRTAVAAAVLSLALVAAAPLLAAPPDDAYTVTPLASDIPGVAPTFDLNLVNGWGLARSATSPWWVADNGTDKTTIYNGAGVLQTSAAIRSRRRRRPDRRGVLRDRRPVPGRNDGEPDDARRRRTSSSRVRTARSARGEAARRRRS